MQWFSTMAMAAVVSLAVAGMAQAQPTRPAEGEKHSERPTITVTGRGEVRAKPDRATIRLGAVARAPEAAPAQQKVSAIVSAATKAVMDLGIPEEQIQTASLMLHPEYEHPRPMPSDVAHERREPRITGYRASNTLQVVVDDLSKLGPVIDAAVKAGANQMEGLSFELKDELPQRKVALKEAVEDARAKAEAMAEAMGVKLGGVVEATERASDHYEPILRGASLMAMEAQAVDTPVQPGQVEVSAAVSITYGLDGSGGQR